MIKSEIHHKVFTAGALESGRVLSGYQMGKPSDVRQTMSTYKASLVFIIHPTKSIF